MADYDYSRAHLREDKRYIEWGVNQPIVQKKIISQIKQYYENDKNEEQYIDRPVRSNLAQELRQYKTEYSQVSAIETGFKKLKSNQINILKQLKQQYEVLRNSSLDNRVYYDKKNSESESIQQKSNSSNLSSLRSKRSITKLSDKRQLQNAHLQKKQLELMLNNSMKKIQELLHNEIELKNVIMDLRNKQEKRKWSQNEGQMALKRSGQAQEGLRRTNKQLQRQIQSMRATMKETIVKNGTLEGNLHVKQLQYKKLQQKIRLMQQQLRLQKSKYLSLQLELKKIQGQYSLLQKLKNDQSSFYKKNRTIQEDNLFSDKLSQIRRLQEELVIKDQRYALLLNKFNKLNRISNGNQDISDDRVNSSRIFEQFAGLIKQDRNRQNDESYRQIIQKLNKIDNKSDDKLVSQINFLKNQLELLKNSRKNQQSNIRNEDNEDLSRARSRIKQLQKIIDEQNVQKMYFVQDMQKINKNYSALKREKQNLQRQLMDSHLLIEKLQYQNQRYHENVEKIKNTNMDLTDSQLNNQTLVKKMQLFNLKETQMNWERQEIHKKIKNYIVQISQYEEELMLLKRKLDDQQFKNLKITQQYQYKLKVLTNEGYDKLQKFNNQIQQTQKSYALQKAQLINQRIQWEKKHFLLNEQHEKMLKQLSGTTKGRQLLVNKKAEEYEMIMKVQRQNNMKQMNSMLGKIQSLSLINERLMGQAGKYMEIQAQIFQLKKIIRTNRRLTQNLDHLWSIKEVEYNNINQILHVIKQE